ncbi:MAG TPA: hypothetical protein VJZ00_17825 [Thermoanaerobaculia bacterium]|nr:hypothetical protein [Thermoanaerobaculia bacterium]
MNNEYPEAVVCIENEGNEVSLQLWKIYKPLPDDNAISEGFLRVVDESGEDYLFPEDNFVPIDLPSKVKRLLDRAVREQPRAAAPAKMAAVKRLSARAAKNAKRPA